MKHISGLLLSVALFAFCFTADGQNNPGSDWMSRMRSEKIAFLTAEMGLTPEEAQIFWPIYNKAEAEETAAFNETRKCFTALNEAVQQKKSQNEIKRLLHEYTDAVAKSQGIQAKYVSQYEKVISVEKVAKLFLAEERFRNNQIMRLQGGGFNGGGNFNGGGFNGGNNNRNNNIRGFGFPGLNPNPNQNQNQNQNQRQKGTDRL